MNIKTREFKTLFAFRLFTEKQTDTECVSSHDIAALERNKEFKDLLVRIRKSSDTGIKLPTGR